MEVLKFKNRIISLTILGLFIPALISAMVVKATVETKPASNVSLSSVRLNGDVIDDGGCADMELWFDWGRTTKYTNKTSVIERRTLGRYSQKIAGLSPCTTYHFRAAVKNNTKKTSYGQDKTFTTECPSFELTTAVKNITRGDTTWYDSISADPGDELLFRIWLKSTSNFKIENARVRVNLAQGINYLDELTINDTRHYESIVSNTINIGDITANQVKAITFKAQAAEIENLPAGSGNLISTALVYTPYISKTDSFIIKVKGSRAGPPAGQAGSGVPVAEAAGPTDVSTGIGATILGSILLPFGLAFFLVWISRSRLIGFDRWSEKRKKEITEYRADKALQRKIAQAE